MQFSIFSLGLVFFLNACAPTTKPAEFKNDPLVDLPANPPGPTPTPTPPTPPRPPAPPDGGLPNPNSIPGPQRVDAGLPALHELFAASEKTLATKLEHLSVFQNPDRPAKTYFYLPTVAESPRGISATALIGSSGLRRWSNAIEAVRSAEAEVDKTDEAKLRDNLNRAAFRNLIYNSNIEDRYAENLMDSAIFEKWLAKIENLQAGDFTLFTEIASTDFIQDYQRRRRRANLEEISIRALDLNYETRNFGPVPVAELEGSADAKVARKFASPFIRKILHSGKASPFTTNLSLALHGAEAFFLAPPPIILPVTFEADAQIGFPIPAHGALECRFNENNWKIFGSREVAKNAWVFDENVFEHWIEIGPTIGKLPCVLHVSDGIDAKTEQAAIAQAAVVLGELMNVRKAMLRISLTPEQRQKFYATSPSENSNNKSQNFFWLVTDSRSSQIEIGNNFTFRSEIWHRVTLSKPICVAYSPRLDAYVACNEEEREVATTLPQARYNALHSPECAKIESFEECRANRIKNAPRFRSTGNIKN